MIPWLAYRRSGGVAVGGARQYLSHQMGLPW